MIGMPVSLVKLGESSLNQKLNQTSILMFSRRTGQVDNKWLNDFGNVIILRNDGEDFTIKDYLQLDKYIRFLLEIFRNESGCPNDLFKPQKY